MSRIHAHTPPLGSPTVQPRALNLHQAALYLGISYWSVRDYVLAGLLPVIEMPALRPRERERPRANLRRVLVDRSDLVRFIESRKTYQVGSDFRPDGAGVLQSPAPAKVPSNAGRNMPVLCPDS